MKRSSNFRDKRSHNVGKSFSFKLKKDKIPDDEVIRNDFKLECEVFGINKKNLARIVGIFAILLAMGSGGAHVFWATIAMILMWRRK